MEMVGGHLPKVPKTTAVALAVADSEIVGIAGIGLPLAGTAETVSSLRWVGSGAFACIAFGAVASAVLVVARAAGAGVDVVSSAADHFASSFVHFVAWWPC